MSQESLLVIGGITPAMVQALKPVFDLHYLSDQDDPLVWLKTHGADIRYVLTNGHDGVAADYCPLLPNLALISNYGVGYDAIDTEWAVDQHIIVTHTPDVLNAEVASSVIMLLLACYRELLSNEAHARSGAWASEGNAPLSRTADGRVVGIVGMGRIGLAIARKLEAFDAEILYHARTEKDVPYAHYAVLEEMAKRAEVLICIVPGGAETRHLINAPVLEALGSEGVLINVSRGSVVDEHALVHALQNGTIAAAGLDVFDNEPQISEALCAMNNVVLTPHIGSATVETRAAMGKLCVDNLLLHVKEGRVLTPIPECKTLANPK